MMRALHALFEEQRDYQVSFISPKLCMNPRDAQRDALLSELALDLPLTNCHRAVLEPSESRCKQTDKNDEMACSDHQLTRARLL